MDWDIKKLYEELNRKDLTPEEKEKISRELHGLESAADKDHAAPVPPPYLPGIYDYQDLVILQAFPPEIEIPYTTQLRSMDELLERDKLRSKDGFPRKVRVGKLIKPGKGGKDKVVVVPTTVEEKFIHHTPSDEESGESEGGGQGDGEEGEIIGEAPVKPQGGAGEGGAGEGESAPHEMESSAYDLGKILTEKFELPNLKDKGKKRALTRYTYDLTDRHQGFGQILDKKATLRKLVETNIHLGNIPDPSNIDTTSFLISPSDKIYRILSKEKDYESQAVVFFVRDYSGSMSGKPTELVVSQHIMIYSWLLYQYARQVESRFVVHDTEAKEVPDFFTYYSSKVAGGTKVAAAFRLVNEIIEKESLAKDYNIYVFHGTDGDDWDTYGKETLPQITRLLTYTNRMGITIARSSFSGARESDMERYLKKSGLLKNRPKDIRMDSMEEDAEEPRIIEGIKKLISE